MKPLTWARLALAGSRTDILRVILTATSSAMAAVTLLAAATVAAVPKLPDTDDDPHGGLNHYSADLVAQPGLRPGVVATLLLVALPVLALAGQCIRFGTPARDRRLAAIRLAGATPRQAVSIAAGETAVSALLGSVIGLGLYFVLRAALDRRGDDGQLWLPTDVLPSAVAIVVILLIVPVLAGLAGAYLLRTVIITPLGVVRQSRDHRPSVLPGVLIIAGVFAPFVIQPLGHWIVKHYGGNFRGQSVLVIGALLVLAAILGVIMGTGWISHTTGRLLTRYGRRPAMLLAGRQLMADPWNGSRTLAALLAAVIVGAGVYGYRADLVATIRAQDQVNGSLGDGGGTDTSFYTNTIGLIGVAVYLGMLVAGGGVLVALAESIVTRRRAYAGLVATGVPRRTLGESIAWRTLGPLVPAVLVALIVGVGLARAQGATASAEGGTCDGDSCNDPNSPAWHYAKVTLPVHVPWADLALLGAGACAIMLVVVGVVLIFLRSSTDVEELRVG